MREPIFQSLPDKPDHPGLEREMLARWEAEGTFAKLREQNSGGPTFSFMDGPITANGPAGVHHGIGRTLKDVFQRYKAMHGHELRYQNGFDSQGLHVEVQVEKALGFNSKHEIEEYGLDRFAHECRDFVAKFAAMQTAQSKRLGMWMDWGNDYFTFSDTNIEYIWRFLKEVDRRGWLYKGHRSTQWCPRCGTSLSKHEQAGEVHRVIPWDEVSLDEGTGIVHIAPGCGGEDFELSRVHDLAVLAPIDESGRMLPGYGDLEGKATDEVVIPVIDALRERHLL